MIAFLSILLLVSGGMHFYLWSRLVRSPGLTRPWFAPATAAAVVLALLIPLSLILARSLPRSVHSPVSWIADIWLGLAFLLFVLLLLGEFARLGLFLASLAPTLRPHAAGMTGAAVSRWIAVAAGASALILGAAAMTSALGPVAVKPVRVPLRSWPAARSPYTIVQISDLHVGPILGRRFLSSVVARINRIRPEPDLIAITGDLADGTVGELGGDLAPLAELRARDGVFFVTGNHDHYSGAQAWVAFVRSLGIHVLRNERVAIGGSEGFDLAGVDDEAGRLGGHGDGADLGRALEGRDPARPVVLLAHQPEIAARAASLGVDLQLSGHTHGGQIFPFHLIVRLTQPFLAGLHREGNTWVYVSRGTGTWGPPMRLLAPPEITRVEIVSAAEDTNAENRGSGRVADIRK